MLLGVGELHEIDTGKAISFIIDVNDNSFTLVTL
jgi:hypothetical protein